MENLKLNVFKVLTNKITKEEFEKMLYQPHVIRQIESNEFIENLININYRDKHWKYELRKKTSDYFSEEDFLISLIKSHCIDLIATKDYDRIKHVCSDLGSLYDSYYGEEYTTLLSFNNFDCEFYAIEGGFGLITPEKLIEQVRSYARLFLEAFESKNSVDELLNLSDGIFEVEQKNVLDYEDLVEYSENRILNIESKNKTYKNIGSLGYDDKVIDNIYTEAKISSISKAKSLALMYLLVGFPFVIAGILGVLNEKDSTFVYVSVLIGFGMVVTGLYYLLFLLKNRNL